MLLQQKPELGPVLRPLLEALAALEDQIAKADKTLKRRARRDPVARRLMTAPGVGPVTALVYKSAIEDPRRFARAADVGVYAGLTPRRHQSGELDLAGRISKGGDPMLRHALYAAANSVLARLKRDCALRTWGLALQERRGKKCARVAVARKLALLLHRLWQDDCDFRWAA